MAGAARDNLALFVQGRCTLSGPGKYKNDFSRVLDLDQRKGAVTAETRSILEKVHTGRRKNQSRWNNGIPRILPVSKRKRQRHITKSQKNEERKFKVRRSRGA